MSSLCSRQHRETETRPTETERETEKEDREADRDRERREKREERREKIHFQCGGCFVLFIPSMTDSLVCSKK